MGVGGVLNCCFVLSLYFTHWAISRSSQCSTTGVTKAVVCVICMWYDAYKRTLAANRNE